MITALRLCRRVSLFLGNIQTYLGVKGQNVCTLLSRVQQSKTKQTNIYIYTKHIYIIIYFTYIYAAKRARMKFRKCSLWNVGGYYTGVHKQIGEKTYTKI